MDSQSGLVYPKLCKSCNKKNPSADPFFCVGCYLKIPKTDFHLEKGNEFTKRFWGRLNIETAAAYFRFIKGGRAQPLIHKIKYHNQRKLATELGEEYGRVLKQAPIFRSAHIIVPVPLHPKKEHERGYNQSDLFAIGLSASMKIPWIKNGLKRTKYTETQTKKTKMERLQNMMEVFAVGNTAALIGKHVLLVDDVLTSGATLEACGSKILELPNTKLSLATIAIANH